jgi:hypothetical protein
VISPSKGLEVGARSIVLTGSAFKTLRRERGVATENPDPKGVRQNMEEARASRSLRTVNESRT